MKLLEKFGNNPFPAMRDDEFAVRDQVLAKWQFLAYSSKIFYIPDCGLCAVNPSGCGNCIIYSAVGGCGGKTPYSTWVRAGTLLGAFKTQDAAEAEYLFLEGLYSIEAERRKA